MGAVADTPLAELNPRRVTRKVPGGEAPGGGGIKMGRAIYEGRVLPFWTLAELICLSRLVGKICKDQLFRARYMV